MMNLEVGISGCSCVAALFIFDLKDVKNQEVFGVFQSKYGRFRVSNGIDANVDYFRCIHIFWSNGRYLRSSLISVTFTIKFMKTVLGFLGNNFKKLVKKK